MSGRQAKAEPSSKDRLPGAVTTHASPPLLTPVEIWGMAAFLICVVLGMVALESWASLPLRRGGQPASGPHPLHAPATPPREQLDMIGLLPGAQ